MSVGDDQLRPNDPEPGNMIVEFLGSPIGWTLIVLILSSLGIFRELW